MAHTSAVYVLWAKLCEPMDKATQPGQAKAQVSQLLPLGVALVSAQENHLTPLWRFGQWKVYQGRQGSAQRRNKESIRDAWMRGPEAGL